jgi:6-phosphogluconolactonase
VQPEIVTAPVQELADVLANRLEDEARRAMTERGRFALALSGGSVATSFFTRLARASLDWSRVDFFWGDERALPPDHPESNYGAARRLWLDPAGVPPERRHRMPADSADLVRAAATYATELDRVVGSPPRLDVALLGMGPDGHVCSLFPGHPLLKEERRTVAPIFDSPKPPAERLTLTLPALSTARLVVVAALGEAKADAIRRAVGAPACDLPVALVLGRAARALVLLDSL